VARALAEIAEEPGLWLPDDGRHDVLALDGLVAVTYGSWLAAERIRLRAGDVERALRDVRELARARGVRQVLWWLGGRTTPATLEDELLAQGLGPDPEQPELTTLTLDRPPAGDPVLEVRLVDSLSDYCAALAVEDDAFDLPGERREQRRATAADAWEREAAAGAVAYHLALDEGRPVAFARTVFTPHGGLMLGGATLAGARRRGAYTSLVHARWAEAAARGPAVLGTAAGSMSAPVLRQLGFVEHGRVRVLLDRL
jgi:hypothetical protein